jgi:RNA polymerase sigma factor (sigma-70 family)
MNLSRNILSHPMPLSFQDTPEAMRQCLADRRRELTCMLRRDYGFSREITQQAVEKTILIALRWIEDGRAAAIPNRYWWLRCVALTQARTVYKRQRKSMPTLTDVMVSAESFASAPAEDPTAFDEDSQVRVAVEGLPEQYRAIMELHFFEGHTLVKTAALLGVPLPTVRWRKRRALELLREELTKKCAFSA